MASVKKRMADRVLDVSGAWRRKCPGKTFYSYTLEAFEQRAKPYLDSIEEVARCEAALTHAVTTRDAEARTLGPEVRGVVNAVMGDKEEGGENGQLYAAMGFIPRNARATGLVRRRTAQKPPEVSS
jgi:hypothetical protein